MLALEWYDVFVSTLRWTIGLGIGALCALAISFILLLIRLLQGPAQFAFGFARALPILALVPLFQQIIGVNEVSKITLIAWATFFPIIISSVDAVREPIPDLERRFRLRPNAAQVLFWHYSVPRVLIGFGAGVQVAIGIGWLTVVAAELIGTFSSGPFRGGLGNFVMVAFENGRFDLGFVGLGVFGVLGMGTSFLWSTIYSRVLSTRFVKASS